MARPAALAAAAVLAAGFCLLGWRAASVTSATFDESFNLASGCALNRAGAWLPGQANPPLLLRWLAAPLPAEAIAAFDPAACAAAPRRCGYDLLFGSGPSQAALLLRARSAVLALGLALVLLCGWWAYRLGGQAAGLAALACAALLPPFIANSALATTDGGNALLCTLSLFLLWRGGLSPGPGPAALAGLAAGLAMSGKYTAALLAPLGLLYAALWGGDRLRNSAAFAAAALGGLWMGCLPYSPADWLARAYGVAAELGAGHPSYLLGAVSENTTWYYFPLALLVKTPLPALLLAAAGAASALKGRGRRDALLYLLLPAAAWLLAAMVSGTQVGVRHVLPVYAPLCVLAGLGAAALGRLRAPLGAAASLLLAWQAAGTLASGPWQLSYFNELAGGSRGGHRLLLDSNLDWGQGLKELAAYSREKGADHIYLSYFGCADPRAYGLKYFPVLPAACVKLPGDGRPPRGGLQLLAVSATNRFGVYYRPPGLFAWLDGRPHERIAGNSIWVYDVTGDTEALRMLAHPALDQ